MPQEKDNCCGFCFYIEIHLIMSREIVQLLTAISLLIGMQYFMEIYTKLHLTVYSGL